MSRVAGCPLESCSFCLLPRVIPLERWIKLDVSSKGGRKVMDANLVRFGSNPVEVKVVGLPGLGVGVSHIEMCDGHGTRTVAQISASLAIRIAVAVSLIVVDTSSNE